MPRLRHALGSFVRLEDRTVPAVLTVTNLNDSGPGSLRATLATADATLDPDTIVFDPALANGTIALSTSSNNELGPTALVVSSAITIEGSGQTITRAASVAALRLFRVSSVGQLTLQNLTLSGGSTGQTNFGFRGDGGAAYSDGIFTLEGCTLSGNSARNGGAVWSDGTFTAADCTFTSNRADERGGGLYDAGSAELDRSTLASNRAGDGGAVWSEVAPAQLVMVNCTVAGNTANRTSGIAYAGGVGVHNGTAALKNCTFSGNMISGPSGSKGGALLAWCDSTTIATTVAVDNSILVGSAGDADIRALASPAAVLCSVAVKTPNIVGATSAEGGAFFSGNGLIVANPLLGPLQDNGGKAPTMALQPGSPALNAGVSSAGPTTDERGTARDTPPDLGAYEVQHPLSPVGVPVDPAVMYGPQPSASQNEAFVKGLYQSTLLRQGAPSEVAFYVNQLNTGTLSLQGAAFSFYNSPENRGNQVKFFYRYFLGREPAQSEVDFYVNQLRAGVDEAVIMQNFVLSPEFTGQNNNTQFVQKLYYAILGRNAAQSEIDFYVNQLQSGQATRSVVLSNFLHSQESVQRVARSDWVAYLKRPANSAELAAALANVQGGGTYGSLAIGLLGSQEFFNNAARYL